MDAADPLINAIQFDKVSLARQCQFARFGKLHRPRALLAGEDKNASGKSSARGPVPETNAPIEIAATTTRVFVK